MAPALFLVPHSKHQSPQGSGILLLSLSSLSFGGVLHTIASDVPEICLLSPSALSKVQTYSSIHFWALSNMSSSYLSFNTGTKVNCSNPAHPLMSPGWFLAPPNHRVTQAQILDFYFRCAMPVPILLPGSLLFPPLFRHTGATMLERPHGDHLLGESSQFQ